MLFRMLEPICSNLLQVSLTSQIFLKGRYANIFSNISFGRSNISILVTCTVGLLWATPDSVGDAAGDVMTVEDNTEEEEEKEVKEDEDFAEEDDEQEDEEQEEDEEEGGEEGGDDEAEAPAAAEEDADEAA